MLVKQRLSLAIFLVIAAILAASGAAYLISYNVLQDAGADYTAVKNRINIVLYLMGILSLLLAVTAVIIFRLLLNKVINPIVELNHITTNMAEGRPDVKFEVKGIDELSGIAANLSRIADSYSTCKGQVMTLENTIAQRQKAVRELAILNELMGFITSETRLDIILKSLVDRTKNLIKSDYCAAIIFETDTFMTKFFITSEEIHDIRKVSISPEGFFKLPLKEQIPVRLDSQHVLSENQGRIIIPELNLEIKDILAVPLIFSSEVLGLLIIANKQGGTFDQGDEDMLMNFAFQAFQTIAMHEKIANLAITDGLTGLNNHRHFQEKLMEETEMAKRYSRTLSLLILDIDHFKAFNDSYGHQVGDMALKLIAYIIKQQIRRTDFSARYGGEEFSIIMPETVYSGAKIFAERLRKKIAETPFPLPNGEKALITVSIGFASIPENAKDKNELIGMADKALYIAKEHGRNISYGSADISKKPFLPDSKE